MNPEKLFTYSLLRYMKRGGVLSIIMVIFLLFLDFYNVINLKNFPIPYFQIFLWLYLIINAGIAAPFSYIKEKSNPKCPKCSRTLKIEPSFYCENCGKIEFRKGEGNDQ